MTFTFFELLHTFSQTPHWAWLLTFDWLVFNGRWKRQRRNGIFHASNVILTAVAEFLRNLRNGNGKTATAERGNGMVETRHYTCSTFSRTQKNLQDNLSLG